MTHKATVAAIRLRDFDAKNGCDTRRVVGYRAECSCGWRGSSRGTWTTARSDVLEHVTVTRPLVEPASN